MNHEQELPADLDNLIAGLRIENINLKLAAKKAHELIADALNWLPLGTVMRSNAEAFLASQQGEQATQAEIAVVHPEQAEGAQGEREAFEAWVAAVPCVAGQGKDYVEACLHRDLSDEYTQGWVHEAWSGWKARAALAQPSPVPEQSGCLKCGAETRADKPFCEEHCYEQCPAPGLEQLRYKSELYDEVWELVTGKGYMNVTTAISVLEQERDAAQARVAELEKQEPVAEILVDSRGMIVDAVRRPSDLPSGFHKVYAAPVAQAGQVPEEVRTLLSRAKCEIEHLAECLENVCEDEEDVDVREDVADGREVAANIAHMLAAAPAQGE
ncbi:hypothetical protein [Pseudomonas nitroreducens]|uniref:hypothetical protein n=1 Tax=Pseudomonas nitroreducens TaxID=46680 RepID=UPI003D2C837E